MKQLMVVVSIVSAALFAVSVASARADEWNELTYFTFSAPVELPGLALPAGTYIFEHPDTADVHLVQVLSQDGRTVFGTFSTVPERRTTATDAPQVTFEERSAAAPPAVKAWFYPGRLTGDEFIYYPH